MAATVSKVRNVSDRRALVASSLIVPSLLRLAASTFAARRKLILVGVGDTGSDTMVLTVALMNEAIRNIVEAPLGVPHVLMLPKRVNVAGNMSAVASIVVSRRSSMIVNPVVHSLVVVGSGLVSISPAPSI